MAGPTVVNISGLSSRAISGTSPTVSVTLPTSLVPGNLLVLTFWVATVTVLNNVSATGYTLKNIISDSTDNHQIAVLTRVLDGTETSGGLVTFTFSFASTVSTFLQGIVRQINGENSTAPIDTPVVTGTTSNTNWTTGTYIPDTSSDLLLADFFSTSTGTVSTGPTGMTNDFSNSSTLGSEFNYSKQLVNNSSGTISIVFSASIHGSMSVIILRSSTTNISLSRIFKWNTRASVILSRIFIWNTRTTILLARIFKWNVVVSVIPFIRSFIWNTRLQVNLARGLKWNVVFKLITTKIFLWNVRFILSTTRIFLWNDVTRIIIIRSLVWDIYAPWVANVKDCGPWTSINGNTVAWTPEQVNSTPWR